MNKSNLEWNNYWLNIALLSDGSFEDVGKHLAQMMNDWNEERNELLDVLRIAISALNTNDNIWYQQDTAKRIKLILNKYSGEVK
ncbi:MAG: hypothetical protein ACYDEI_00285 [Erysipelotrichaceae bacterium]